MAAIRNASSIPIESRPFDFVFQKKNILTWQKAVGFMPMRWECFKDPKVRWERGEGGAAEEASNMISLVVGLSRGSKQAYRNGIQLGCHGLGA